MQQNLNLGQIKKSVTAFLHRYHVLIFVLTVIGGLSVATFMLNQAVNTTQTDVPNGISTGGFDTDTMTKIKSLRGTSDAPEPLNLPNGRVNPFQ